MSISVCGIGDIMLGENIHHFRRGIATRYRGRFHSLVSSYVREVLNQADLVVGNLECSLMPDEDLRCAPFDRAVYTAPESALHCFDAWARPLVLNVANNHFGQHGETAMAYTLDRLGKQQGIYVIGRDRAPLELLLNRHRVRLLGVSLVRDRCEDGYFKSSPERLIHDLDWGAKANGSYRILSIHWGDEYHTLPSKWQRKMAQMLVKSGVDLIVGHHPHVIQPVKRVGNAIVAYSHGNFIFDQNFSWLTRTGLITMSELTGMGWRCFKLRSRNYQLLSAEEVDKSGLERFCQRRMNPRAPLIMRALMKLEMIAHGYEVPSTVWRHFGMRIAEKFLHY